MNGTLMRIGELATRAGVPTATVRYYERRGLIAQPGRSASGYREYTVAEVDRIRFIRRAQDLGFALEEIQELLELRVDDPAACPVVEAKTRQKINLVRARIREMHRLESVLERLVASCTSHTPTDECPVLATLYEEAPDA
jgi:Hg(II)-responsive transcriptional regulator